MVKKVKFPLILNDVTCNTLEAVKKNFNIKEMIGYFHDKRLLRWLNDRAYDEEAEAVEKLIENDPHFKRQLCEIFEIDPNTIPDIDTEEEVWRQERLNRLKQYTDDESILEKIDQAAFDQEELGDRLNEELNEIILVNNEFRISTKRENKTYIGIGKVIAVIKSDVPVDFNSLNIKFIGIKFDSEYQKIIDTPQPKPKSDLNFDETIKQCKDKIKNEKDAKKKFELYLKCANLDDVESMCEVAERFLNGNGISHSSKQAIHWYEKAVEFGSIKAMKRLGKIYNEGQFVKRDDKKSFEYYEKAVNLGDIKSMKVLSKMCEWGAGVEKNIYLAQEWAKKANDLETVERLRKIEESFKETKKSNEWGDGVYNPMNKNF